MANCVKCGDNFPLARLNLGYRTCLECGDVDARKVSWASVPINKSNYMLVTNVEELKQLNPKRTGE